MKKILIALLLMSSFVMPQLTHKIGKAKTNFVTTPASSLVNEPNCVFAYEGNAPINKTIVDISGNGNNGTLYGGTMYAGGLDGGLQFNGTSSYVSVPDANSLDFGTGDFSIEWYGKINNVTSEKSLINKALSSGIYTGFYLNVENSFLYFQAINTLAANQIKVRVPIITGTHFIQVIKSASGISIYDKGVLQSATILIDNLSATIDNNSSLLLGKFTAQYFDGTIYSAKLYNVALSAQQVKDKWNKIASKIYINEDFSDGTVGKFPRDWTRISGTHTVQQLATAEGYLKAGTKYLRTDVSGVVAFPSNQAYGRWSFDVYKGADANFPFVQFVNETASIGAYSGYGVALASIEAFVYYKGGATTFISANSYVANTTWYHIDIERTTAGVFSVWITGGAFTTKTLVSTVGGSGTNPITDNTYTSSKWFVLDLDANDRITNIKMWKGISQ